MTLHSTNGAAILTPDEVQDLVIKPLLSSAVSTQVATIVQTASHSTRFPIINADPSTSWVAEGRKSLSAILMWMSLSSRRPR